MEEQNMDPERIKNKDWWKSKTVIAASATFIVAILSAMYGETSTIVMITISLLSALGVYGRVTATHKLK